MTKKRRNNPFSYYLVTIEGLIRVRLLVKLFLTIRCVRLISFRLVRLIYLRKIRRKLNMVSTRRRTLVGTLSLTKREFPRRRRLRVRIGMICSGSVG